MPDNRRPEAIIAKQRLVFARGTSIEAYANLEQSLCSFFTLLIQTPPGTAAVIFFKMANSRSRNEILSKLQKKQFGDTYSAFWNSLIKRVRSLDEMRNQIVHWIEASDLYDLDGVNHWRFKLIPPNFWHRTPDTPSLTIGQLTEFITECVFVSRVLNLFILALKGQECFEGETPDSSLQKFQQPIVYPPPDNYPLFRIYKAPQIPPESFPA